jgi:hypothetical protein
MVECFSTPARGADENLHLAFDDILADVVDKFAWPNRAVVDFLLPVGYGCDKAFFFAHITEEFPLSG